MLKASVELSLNELRCIESCVLERAQQGLGGEHASPILRKLGIMFSIIAHCEGSERISLVVKEGILL